MGSLKSIYESTGVNQ